MTDHTRRAFLRRAALAGGAVALAGCGGRQEDDVTPEDGPDDTPDEIVIDDTSPADPEAVPSGVRDVAQRWEFDAIATLGGETDGIRSLDDVLPQVQDGAMLFLGEGRYRLAEEFSFDGTDRFGIVGRGATVVPDEGNDDMLLNLGSTEGPSRLLVEGIEFDFRAESTGGRPIGAMAADRLVLRDVSITGEQDVHTDTVRIDVTSPDGQGLVERLRMPDGGEPGSWDGDLGVTGCEVGSENRGDVRFVDCHIEGFPDNGLYADPPEGKVEVIGGYFANNGVSNVRVHGDPGSVIRGVHVRCDEARDGVENMRGIRLRGGDAPLVEDCLIELDTVTGSDGAITVHSELAAATIRNCRIRVDADEIAAVRIKAPAEETPADGTITLQNLLVEGGANGGTAVEAAERGAVTIDRACIQQTGSERDGIHTSGVAGRVANSFISVRGQPLALERSNLETVDVQMNRTPRELANLRHVSCQRG